MVNKLSPWSRDDWYETTWGELVELKYGKALKNYKNATSGFPVYGTNGPVGFNETPLCSHPGIIVGRKGAYRGVHYSSVPFFVIDTAFYIQPRFDINLKWAYYELLQQDINGLDSGSAIPSTRREDFYALQVKIPPRHIQDEICILLDSLNNKVLINRQINQTLEQMAQVLFKSWFVDFDPVVDNALDAGFFEQDLAFPDELLRRAEARRAVREHGDFKSLPDAIRQLFPAAFEECAGPSLGLDGWVPKGWGIHAISDIAFINKESWTKNNAPERIKYVDLSNAKDGIILGIQEYFFEEAPSRARRILKKRDTIFGMVRPANYSFAYVDRNGLTGSTGFVVISAKNKNTSSFLYQKLTSDSVLDDLIRVADGAAYPAIKPDDISEITMAVPNKCILDLFEQTIDGYRERVAHNLNNNEQLTNLRDTLLPKLISGELRLDNIEAQLTKDGVA